MDKSCPHHMVPASEVLPPALSPKPPTALPSPSASPTQSRVPPLATSLHTVCIPPEEQLCILIVPPLLPNHACNPPTEPTGGVPFCLSPTPSCPPPRVVISGEQAYGGGGTLFTFLGSGGSGGFGAAGHFGALGRTLRFRFCSPAWGEGGAGGGRKAGMIGEGGTGRIRDGARSRGGPMYHSSRSCHPTALRGRMSRGGCCRGGDADTRTVMVRGECRYPKGDAVGGMQTTTAYHPLLSAAEMEERLFCRHEKAAWRGICWEKISISLFPMGWRGPRMDAGPSGSPRGMSTAEDAMLPEAARVFPEHCTRRKNSPRRDPCVPLPS